MCHGVLAVEAKTNISTWFKSKSIYTIYALALSFAVIVIDNQIADKLIFFIIIFVRLPSKVC